MNKIIAIFSFLTMLGVVFLTVPEGIAALLIVLVLGGVTIILLRQHSEDSDFLIQVFLVALIARIVFGVIIHVYNLREFFGADALSYDAFGLRVSEVWAGTMPADDPISVRSLNTGTPGWGLTYLVAIIYFVIGKNILAAQFFCATIGAATAPMVYICAQKIYKNRRVGQTAALMVALFPAFIIWSGQLLKDGLIIFLLVLAMTMVLQLQDKFDYFAVIFLVFALFGILSLRFYIFYMVAISVAGSFVLGQGASVKAIVRGFLALAVLGVGLTYLGVTRTATENFDKFGSLESVQRSRDDLAKSADSGYGEDIDVSTTAGAISAIPLGFSYLMLAPFPWQVTNLRQAITLPEILVWWFCIPFGIYGLLYTLKNRLRAALPVLIFTVLLTLAYSIFQGNVGTAYRQRTQIQVFLFIFMAVGFTLRREKRENRKTLEKSRRERVDRQLRDRRRDEQDK